MITKLHTYDYASNIHPNNLKHKIVFIFFSTRSAAIYYIRLLKQGYKIVCEIAAIIQKMYYFVLHGQTYQFKNIRKPM